MGVWKRYTDQEKKEILEEFEKSAEGQRLFCKRKNMSRTTLRTWIKESKNGKPEKNKKVDFGVIHLVTNEDAPEGTNTQTEPETILFKCDNIEIKLKQGYDKNMLQQIFEVFTYVK